MKYVIKGNYFDGEFHLPPLHGTNSVENFIDRKSPADLSQHLWRLPIDYRHVEPTLQSCIKGFHTWKKTPLEKRIEALKRFQEQVITRKDELAEAIALESGKPLWEAYSEANSVIGKVDVTLEHSLPRVETKRYENILPSVTGHLHYKPIGPCLVIGPFNFPCHLANTQILAALVCGNSVIFKPSEKTAYSGQLLMECFDSADFPQGVVNLIQGDGEIAGRLVKEKEIKGVFFTGSKEVGQKILKSTYQHLDKLVALELGGKNVAVVAEDAPLEHTLEELIKGSFLTSGQRCTSTSLVAIHRSLLDGFIERFHSIAKKILIDHPTEFNKEPFMGPLVDLKSVESYLLYMGMAKREGIEEIMRGKKIERPWDGHYVSPSIHLSSKLNKESHFLQSEIFGPNCTFIPYDDLDEAMEIANFSEYGLASCVFTQNKSIYQHCLEIFDSGLVNLNRSTCGASPKLPFGGIKNSGNYHPMAVAAIDSCVYQMTGLEIENPGSGKFEGVKGIDI